MASEQREARGSLGNMRLGRLKVPEFPEPIADFVFLCVAGFVGGLRDGAAPSVGMGMVFSKPSRPRVGGADSARAIGAGFIILVLLFAGAGDAMVAIFRYWSTMG
jgi:hypothetical protein